MARLKYVDSSTLDAPARTLLARLPDLNIFKMAAHASANFRHLIGLGSTILGRQKLDARLRELAILRVAALSEAEYEWAQHEPLARGVGATDIEVAAARSGDVTGVDEVVASVLSFTAELVAQVRVSDSTLARARRHLDERETVELIVAVGYYMMLARLMVTCGIEPDPAVGMELANSARARSSNPDSA